MKQCRSLIDIAEVLPVFYRTVDYLVCTGAVNSRPLFAESSDGRLLNFKVTTFKNILTKQIKISEGQEPERILKLYLKTFRALGLILSVSHRLTNISWIAGKSMRVITIKKEVYESLKALEGIQKSGKD